MTSGQKNRIRLAIGHRPTVSCHPQKSACSRAMCRTNPSCVPTVNDLVTWGDERPADVVHEDAQAGRAAGGVERHGDDRVVDHVGKTVVEAGPPHLVLPVVGVAGHPHDPVRLGVEHLQEAGPTRRRSAARNRPRTWRPSCGPVGGPWRPRELLDRVHRIPNIHDPQHRPHRPSSRARRCSSAQRQRDQPTPAGAEVLDNIRYGRGTVRRTVLMALALGTDPERSSDSMARG